MSIVSLRRIAARVLVAAALIFPVFATTGALAEEEAETAAQAAEVERGRLLYRIHCASCHGTAARGKGPIAADLKVPPSDLTRLALRAGGNFSDEDVARTIDGREGIRSHGTVEMPVWGATFQDLGRDSDQHDEVRAKIDAVVAYLRSIQEKAEGTQ